jgi:hypothetical protein
VAHRAPLLLRAALLSTVVRRYRTRESAHTGPQRVLWALFPLDRVLEKPLVCGTCVATLTCEFLDAKNPTFQLAYMAQWANVTNSLYSLGWVLNTLLTAATTPPPQTPDTTATAGLLIRFTWVLFELAVHLGAGATLLFRYFMFDPDEPLKSYYALATHGGLWILILLDGLVVNRIPLRWMHYFGIIMPVEASYGLWTYVQYATQIGNPDTNGGDDAFIPASCRGVATTAGRKRSCTTW